METFQIHPIGMIHSCWSQPNDMPIQPRYAQNTAGTVEVFPTFVAGLKDLEGFERIWLLYWFHQAPPERMLVRPFKDTVERGLFSTRAPCRPNPIGLSAVRLLEVKDNILRIAEVDILDGTPLLDIKPYVPEFDAYDVRKIGWLENANGRTVADQRFMREEKP